MPSGEDWPMCPNCGRPMELFAQLSSDDLPEEATSFGTGLLQLLYCTSETPLCWVDCDGHRPFGRSVMVRIIDNVGVEPRTRPKNVREELRIVGWIQLADYPDYAEFELEAAPLTFEDYEDECLEPKPYTKLGGWPHWDQGADYPSCPKCGAAMGFVLQLASNDKIDYDFGDGGVGHVMQCSTHRDVLSFHWSCS